MKYFLCLMAFMLFVTPAHAEDPCEAAMRKFEGMLRTLPAKCEQDEECGGYYYRLGKCSPAVILNIKEVESGDEFLEFRVKISQMEVRKACPSIETLGSACTPAPYVAACVKQRCTDASLLPPPATPEK